MRAILPVTDPHHPTPRVGDLPDPAPGPGEVLVAVEAAGLNHADLHQLRGTYPPPPGESDVPGLECSGVILEGEPGSVWQPGTRVMALLGGGGHATRVAIPVGQLMPLPDNLSFIEGAAIPEAALTAWVNLVVEGRAPGGRDRAHHRRHGRHGELRRAARPRAGARVLAAGRNRERLEMLRGLGIEEVCLEGANLPGQVREATGGRGVDLVIEFTGGAGHGRSPGGAGARGRLVLIGSRGWPQGGGRPRAGV